MMLKSAYALTVAEFGLDRILDPLAVSAILGRNHDLGNVLGSTPDICAPENAQPVTQIQTFKSERCGENIAVVMIKLLGTLPTPIYIAVTATIRD